MEELRSLNRNIWWEWDSSLFGQIQKLRATFSEKQDDLKNSFDEFAKKMSENNMKSLIEAIQKVMQDFNSKINDQLWQSFKDLTIAIDNLLKWQDEYKQNIVTTMDSLNISKESLEKSSSSFEIIVEKSESFVWISQSLWNELVWLNNWLEKLKSGLYEFDGIANNTKEMADVLIKTIESLTNNFVSKAEDIVNDSSEYIKSMKESLTNQTREIKEMHRNILGEMKHEIENNNRISSEQFLRMQSRLEEQVIEFDQRLWEELEKSLVTLWQQLTGLSWKFVSDYWNLAEKLEKLVNLSK